MSILGLLEKIIHCPFNIITLFFFLEKKLNEDKDKVSETIRKNRGRTRGTREMIIVSGSIPR
jgi:hypothetical protein